MPSRGCSCRKDCAIRGVIRVDSRDLTDSPLPVAVLAAQYLVENVEARDCHLSTGFIGTKDLMLALAKIGRNDVAYRLIHNDTFPSWRLSLNQTRRDEHLGALGRMDAPERLPRPRHELL